MLPQLCNDVLKADTTHSGCQKEIIRAGINTVEKHDTS